MTAKKVLLPKRVQRKPSIIYCPQCKKGELKDDRKAKGSFATEMRKICENCYTRWRIVFHRID